MSIAANAVTDLIAPAPPPQSAVARDDESGARFRDHLDAQTASNDPPDHHPTRTRESAKPTKPAKPESSNQNDDSEAAQDANSAADADDSKQAGASDTPTESAHALLVQVFAAQAAPETPATPTPPAVQQPPVVTTAATSPATSTSLLAQLLDAQPKTAQPASAPSTSAQKSGKGDAKADKVAADQAQAEAQPAAPTPTPQTAAVAQVATAVSAPSNATPNNDAAIGAVQANGQRAAAPADPKSARLTPQTKPAPDGPAANAKGEAPKTDAARAAKAATATGAAKAATANTSDFNDLLRAASAVGESSGPASTTPSACATATQAAPLSDASGSDLAARAAAAPISAQVAREIVRRANGDNTRFELRLDPPELGKIQVQLDVSRDHKVTAVVSADNPQALNDLSRGARDLQQALQSAGLDLADDGLSFNLSNPQNGFSQPDQSNTGGNAGALARSGAAENQSSADTSTVRARPLSIESWRGSRIDVMA